ncbi:DsbA family protein [Chelativorans sp. Marseille-P2723]|uniref:DsbA family protein n=1 Tax=Chelativorans sp. Marseille-P2723 TaxID=2709133 RepID=UPI00157151B2|nr:DsbA family protein [Chelativorans sp. Marseille-P2723]
MTGSTSRRRFLTTMAAIPALSLLAACDNGPSAANAQGSTASGSANAPQSSGSVNMERLLEAGPLPEMAMGDEDAPVTIVEYASMTCSHCANFHTGTFPALKEQYIDTGKVQYILREFPFDPRAEAGFMLARCAEGKYFPMVDVLFQQQSNWATAQDARTALFNISKLAGFSQESFEACLTNQELLDDVRAVRARGAEFGVDSTPTFFINGRKYAGAMSIEEMSAIIDPLL